MKTETSGRRRGSPNPIAGPLCNTCNLPIMFVRDDDVWRHLDALADDDAHAAVPQIQK